MNEQFFSIKITEMMEKRTKMVEGKCDQISWPWLDKIRCIPHVKNSTII